MEPLPVTPDGEVKDQLGESSDVRLIRLREMRLIAAGGQAAVLAPFRVPMRTA